MGCALVCVGGDFSVVCFPRERLGATRMSNHMWHFNDFIQAMELVDFPLQGATFTWTNNQDSRVSSWLDRFLLSSDWLDVSLMVV